MTLNEPKNHPLPLEQAAKLNELTVRAQAALLERLRRMKDEDNFEIPDPGVVSEAMTEASMRLMARPKDLLEAQAGWLADWTALLSATTKRLMGEEAQPVITPPPGDKRFHDAAWTEDPTFDFLKQSYLIGARWTQTLMDKAGEGMDEKTARKVQFYTRQMIDALSPTNFAMTNPVVLRAAAESKGEILIKGLENFVEDLERGGGRLSISMTDYEAFRVGENIAVTPGKVVFQNDLMQLIQYAPSTEQVFKRPLLIVPPWINKFYILDLKPKNSFIKWAVDQGHTVFVISWVNPGEEHAEKSFDHYLSEGTLAALDAIAEATGEKSVNVIGYCIGGTLTACTLAYMAAKGDKRIASATFFTAMTDFTDAGELGVFIDERQLDLLEKHMEQKGYLEGRHMAQVFNMMRDNDLIWSFVVNNYLLGKDPFPFDLLYWNSDATRMPHMMHSFYLRKMYLENRLVRPGGIELLGIPLDLRKIKTPVYMLSTREDHIAPWKSTYAATQLYKGPVKFVLSASGHIAGVVNPPAANKYNYWLNDKLPADPEEWFAGAEKVDGSWWPDWQAWVTKHAGAKVPARQPKNAIEDAPGSYVKVRLAG